MAGINVLITIDRKKLRRIREAAERAAEKTMDAVLTEVKNSGAMPFDTGSMQNGGTYEKTGLTVKGNQVETSNEGGSFRASLINDAPQARRLYFNPKYNFQRGHNANAGARWMDDYLGGGDKGRFIPDTYVHFLKEELKGK